MLAILPCPVPPTPTKVCTRCKAAKVLGDFYGRQNRSSGIDSHCKDCARARRRAAYELKPSRHAAFDPNATTKLCKKCNVEKPLDMFHADKKRRGGRYVYCKECHYFYMRNRYATKPGVREQRLATYKLRLATDPTFKIVAKGRSLKHYSTVKGRASRMFQNAQRSPDGCSITLEWVMRGIEGGICPVTGIAFDLTNGHQRITGRAKNPYSPSLDRIDPKGPYSPNNTRVVIWQYNMMKGELSDGEIFEICRRILGQNAAVAA